MALQTFAKLVAFALSFHSILPKIVVQPPSGSSRLVAQTFRKQEQFWNLCKPLIGALTIELDHFDAEVRKHSQFLAATAVRIRAPIVDPRVAALASALTNSLYEYGSGCAFGAFDANQKTEDLKTLIDGLQSFGDKVATEGPRLFFLVPGDAGYEQQVATPEDDNAAGLSVGTPQGDATAAPTSPIPTLGTDQPSPHPFPMTPCLLPYLLWWALATGGTEHSMNF